MEFLEILFSALVFSSALFSLGKLSCPVAFWGPGIHIQLTRKLLGEIQKTREPSRDQKIVLAHPDHFYYGNIAADIINIKKYGGIKNHCHNWNIQDRLESCVDTDTERAFVLGYLCHLAADLTAHNNFVPFHIVHNLPPRYLNHLYWEALADAHVADDEWEIIAAIRRNKTTHRNDLLVHRAVKWKALGIRSNKWIFNTILLVSLRRSWREVIRNARQRESRHTLQDEVFHRCWNRCLAEMRAVFEPDRFIFLKLRDPTGRSALRAARRLRREIRRTYSEPGEARKQSCGIARKAFGEIGFFAAPTI